MRIRQHKQFIKYSSLGLLNSILTIAKREKNDLFTQILFKFYV